MKIGRNDECWCKSGLKYKNCHCEFDNKLKSYEQQNIEVPTHDIIKNKEQINGIKKAGKLNTMVLDKVGEMIKEGISTDEIDLLVYKTITDNGGIPATLGYYGYPKSVCTSINNEICHGIPSETRILKSGDIVNVDVTTILDGYYADASRTYCIGDVSEDVKKLVDVAKECLLLGLKAVKPWGRLGDVGYAINEHATKNGYKVVEDIGGHGVGVEFHEDPYVCHIGQKDTGMLLVPGMIFTIEPMINMGSDEFYEDEENGWTVYTADGKHSAQWEYTVLVTEDGAEIITY